MVERYLIEPGDTVELEAWLSYRFLVRKNKSTSEAFEYHFEEEPRGNFISYEGFGPFFRRVLRLQIEPGGKLFVLDGDKNFPLTDFSKQPEGFPLTLEASSLNVECPW